MRRPVWTVVYEASIEIRSAIVFGTMMVILVFMPLSLPWSRSMHVQLQAGAYGELNPGAWVELSGAKVGSVERVDYQGGFARIRLSIDRRYAPQLHADTTAAIRPHGLLGPKYVYLNGGSNGSLRDGALIPLSRTTVSTDFDQVLNSLQSDVRARPARHTNVRAGSPGHSET